MKKFAFIILILVLGRAVARSQQHDRDASNALETYVSRILDAIKTKDNRLAEQLIGGLVMKNDDPWFARQVNGDVVKDAYVKEMKEFVKTTRELYAADI